MIGKNSRYVTFLYVGEYKSISEAAKKLGVSQPAVSSDISTLEDELGAELFVRTNRGVKFTPQGQALFENVKKGIALIEAGERRVREITSPDLGTVRIAATEDTLFRFVFEDIATFREKNAGVAVFAHISSPEKICEEIRRWETDIALVCEPICGDFNDIKSVPVREIQDVFVCHPTSPLSRIARVTKKQLCEYPINTIWTAQSENLAGASPAAKKNLSSWLGTGFTGFSVTMPSAESLISLSERGLGISCVPEEAALCAVKDGRVSKISTADALPKRKMYIAYSTKSLLSCAARELVDTITENLSLASNER